MSKEENVIKYYVLCNQLKNVIRTGWKDWHVKKERLEKCSRTYLWCPNACDSHEIRISI